MRPPPSFFFFTRCLKWTVWSRMLNGWKSDFTRDRLGLKTVLADGADGTSTLDLSFFSLFLVQKRTRVPRRSLERNRTARRHDSGVQNNHDAKGGKKARHESSETLTFRKSHAAGLQLDGIGYSTAIGLNKEVFIPIRLWCRFAFDFTVWWKIVRGTMFYTRQAHLTSNLFFFSLSSRQKLSLQTLSCYVPMMECLDCE